MNQSCSNASSCYVGGWSGSGLDDWNYPDFQVLSRPPPAWCWLTRYCDHCFFYTQKRGKECSQEQ